MSILSLLFSYLALQPDNYGQEATKETNLIYQLDLNPQLKLRCTGSEFETLGMYYSYARYGWVTIITKSHYHPGYMNIFYSHRNTHTHTYTHTEMNTNT